MKESISFFNEPILFLVFAAIFFLLFVVINRVLKEISFFKRSTAVLAACVSLLSITGLVQLVAGGGGLQNVNNNKGRAGNILEWVLLPYTVLGIAIILLLLLGFIARIFRSDSDKRYFAETKLGRAERRYLFKKASEACQKSNEESHIRK